MNLCTMKTNNMNPVAMKENSWWTLFHYETTMTMKIDNLESIHHEKVATKQNILNENTMNPNGFPCNTIPQLVTMLTIGDAGRGISDEDDDDDDDIAILECWFNRRLLHNLDDDDLISGRNNDQVRLRDNILGLWTGLVSQKSLFQALFSFTNSFCLLIWLVFVYCCNLDLEFGEAWFVYYNEAAASGLPHFVPLCSTRIMDWKFNS